MYDLIPSRLVVMVADEQCRSTVDDADDWAGGDSNPVTESL